MTALFMFIPLGEGIGRGTRVLSLYLKRLSFRILIAADFELHGLKARDWKPNAGTLLGAPLPSIRLVCAWISATARADESMAWIPLRLTVQILYQVVWSLYFRPARQPFRDYVVSIKCQKGSK